MKITAITRRPFKALVGAALALCTLAVTTATNSPSASAWSTSTSGYAGYVQPGYVTGTYGSQQGYYGNPSSTTPALYVPGASVYRSAGSTGTQWVQYIVTVERRNGNGYWEASGIAKTYTFQIPVGWTGVTAPAFKENVEGLVRVKIGVAWYTPNWQQLLGARAVVMDSNSDYRCDSTYILCTPMWGGVNISD